MSKDYNIGLQRVEMGGNHVEQVSVNKKVGYIGKIVGDSNPSKAYRGAHTSIGTPTTNIWTELTQAAYDQISLNDTTAYTSGNIFTNGQYRQLRFDIDVLEAVRSIDGVDSNASVLRVKEIIDTITPRIKGRGQGANGGVLTYGLTVKAWNYSSGSYLDVGASTDSTSVEITGVLQNASDYISPEGKITLVAHTTYASNGTIEGSVTVEVADAVVSVRKEQMVNPRGRLVPIELDATTTEQKVLADFNSIFMLANDGTDHIYFGFDSSTYDGDKLTMGVSETLNNPPIARCKYVTFRAKSGIQPFRLWGVK